MFSINECHPELVSGFPDIHQGGFVLASRFRNPEESARGGSTGHGKFGVIILGIDVDLAIVFDVATPGVPLLLKNLQ